MSIATAFRQIFRSLSYRNFRLFISGQLVSMVGTWLQTIALSWLIYRLTGSSLLLGSISFALQFPLFVIAPFGGALADRVVRRRMLMITGGVLCALTATLGVLTIAGAIGLRELFIFAALVGVTSGIDTPMRQAFVVEMVGKRDLPNAIALNSSVVNMARIVGPSLGGILVSSVGEGWCFFFNGLSYLGVIGALALIRVDEGRGLFRRNPSDAAGPLRDMARGFRFVARVLPMRAILLLIGLVSLAGMPYLVMMPIFADQVVGSGSRTLGLLLGANGLGALMSALLLAARQDSRGLLRWISVSALGFGGLLIFFSLSQQLWLSMALLIGVGFCAVMQLASTNTLLQTLTSDAMRGRVMAAYSMMVFGMTPVGALLSGWVSNSIGVPLTVRYGGVVSLVGAVVFAAMLPRVERALHRHLAWLKSREAVLPPDEPPSHG